jgi:hypothetical protein
MLGASYKTKKACRESIGKAPRFIETSIVGVEFTGDGKYTVVGPGPYDRKWYAQVTVYNGVITKVT